MTCQHKKRYFPDISRQRNETVNRDYDRRSSSLEGEPSDVVWVEEGSLCHAVYTAIIIEKDNDGVPESFSGFFIAFADILLQVRKHGD